jgi:hypothetical protein
MNSLEEEYSFLAPTWKLPSVGTTSMHQGPSYSSSLPKIPLNSVGEKQITKLFFVFFFFFVTYQE